MSARRGSRRSRGAKLRNFVRASLPELNFSWSERANALSGQLFETTTSGVGAERRGSRHVGLLRLDQVQSWVMFEYSCLTRACLMAFNATDQPCFVTEQIRFDSFCGSRVRPHREFHLSSCATNMSQASGFISHGNRLPMSAITRAEPREQANPGGLFRAVGPL